MKYLTLKHPKGLAIITWGVDEISPTEDYCSEDFVVYYLHIDVYELNNILVMEDGIGGVAISQTEGTREFAEQMLKDAKYHWEELS